LMFPRVWIHMFSNAVMRDNKFACSVFVL
jgi:hypothetical protein